MKKKAILFGTFGIIGLFIGMTACSADSASSRAERRNDAGSEVDRDANQVASAEPRSFVRASSETVKVKRDVEYARVKDTSTKGSSSKDISLKLDLYLPRQTPAEAVPFIVVPVALTTTVYIVVPN